jgi:hypothetical protein
MRERQVGWTVILGFVSLAGCTVEEKTGDTPTVARTTSALGVPADGFPSWRERVVFVLTNRARADPAAEIVETCPDTCGGTYPAAPPVVEQLDLARAARFQATSMRKAGAGLQHASVCALATTLGERYPAQCDGSPSCACQSGMASCACGTGQSQYCDCPAEGCTSWSTRAQLFGVTPSAENAAAGSTDPVSTFGQWIRSTGHRNNLLDTRRRQLGVGQYSGEGECWSSYWIQVFAGASVSIPAIPAGAHYPAGGATTTEIKFWANYYDVDGAPQLARVNIDGTCYPMTLERGSTQNGTWLHSAQLPSAGCHHYYFYFRDGDGTVVSYPSSGSFSLGIGGEACANYAPSTRPPLGTGCGCTTAADCDDANPCTSDGCTAGSCENTPVADCCVEAADCDDGNTCASERCTDNACEHTVIPGCCSDAADCDDGDACTTDDCVANVCAATPIADCCAGAADCDDGNACTSDACVANRCENAPIADCCADAADCDDSNLCTTDSCQGGLCENIPIADCCADAADCDDGDPCTTNSCDSGSCTTEPVAGCCSADIDCDDGDPCSAESCVRNACQRSSVSGCCTTDADCEDGDPCSTDSCSDNSCQHEPVLGCCTGPSQCDDGDPCTADDCMANSCDNTPISGCCSADAQCDDGSPLHDG